MRTNKFATMLLFLILIPITTFAQSDSYIQYNIIGDNTVEVAGVEDNHPTPIVIPATVSIEGKSYTVEAIGEKAFDYKYISEIELPATIKIIRKEAFCHSSLKQIKLPIGLERIEEAAFRDCNQLRYVYFPPSLVYLGENCFSDCPNFVKQEGYHCNIIRGGRFTNLCFYKAPVDNQIRSDAYQSRFSYNYIHKIYKAMQEWQKKKDFETIDQWHTRVTTQNRERKMNQFVNQFKQEFAQSRGSVINPNFRIGLYDDDYNLYALETNSYGTIYVSVSSSEKEYFKNKFNTSNVSPTYCVKEDKLAIASVIVTIKGKTYTSPPVANEDSNENLLAMELPPLDFKLKDDDPFGSVARSTITYDKALDENIPVSSNKAINTFVVAIGNENYQLAPRVLFAENDMNIFSQYCQKTLGVPLQNIRKYKDATFGVILSALNDLKDIADAYDGDLNIIFYYAGHGVPSESNRNAYLLPTDADGKQTEVCFPLSRLYQELGKLNAKSVIVFMDACFSGSQRGEGMLASARGVAIKAKEEAPQGNVIIFSAATGNETAFPYKEKGHGMFTYFLLKKLQETEGNCTLGELSKYIITNVKRQSVITNRKSQTPTVIPAVSIEKAWEGLKLK